jgi:hypothetical protein
VPLRGALSRRRQRYATYMQSKRNRLGCFHDKILKSFSISRREAFELLPLRERTVAGSGMRSSLFPVILRYAPQACLEGCAAGVPRPSPFEARWRSHLRVTGNGTRPIARPGDLLASAGLTWSAGASHGALRLPDIKRPLEYSSKSSAHLRSDRMYSLSVIRSLPPLILFSILNRDEPNDVSDL